MLGVIPFYFKRQFHHSIKTHLFSLTSNTIPRLYSTTNNNNNNNNSNDINTINKRMAQKYKGSCHCGSVQFEAEVDLKSGANKCNCSLCFKLNMIMSSGSNLHFIKGKENLQDYQFGSKTYHHWFCKTCGLHPYMHGKTPDGNELLIFNVTCLENVNLSGLSSTTYDGKGDTYAVLKTETL